MHADAMIVAGIEWDDGNWPKCAKHGVSKSEVEYVLRNMDFRSRDPHALEERFRTAKRTPDGRFVFVAFTHRQRNGDIFLRPITARYMHEKEVRDYERTREEALAKTRNR